MVYVFEVPSQPSSILWKFQCPRRFLRIPRVLWTTDYLVLWIPPGDFQIPFLSYTIHFPFSLFVLTCKWKLISWFPFKLSHKAYLASISEVLDGEVLYLNKSTEVSIEHRPPLSSKALCYPAHHTSFPPWRFTDKFPSLCHVRQLSIFNLCSEYNEDLILHVYKTKGRGGIC